MGKKIVPVVRGKKKSKGSAAVSGTARRAAASFLAILLAVSDVGVGYAVEGNGDISMELISQNGSEKTEKDFVPEAGSDVKESDSAPEEEGVPEGEDKLTPEDEKKAEGEEETGPEEEGKVEGGDDSVPEEEEKIEREDDSVPEEEWSYVKK